MANGRSEKPRIRHRYGIGEWYGRSLARLNAGERQHFAEIQNAQETVTEPLLCPFRGNPDERIPCTKKGGVCSIRLYEQQVSTGVVSLPPGQTGSLVTTCPYRFEQDGTILNWVGETLLGHPQPQVAEQVGFLQQAEESSLKFVGRIDKVLVHPVREPLLWCALEIQAVYFSGPTMSKEFNMLGRFSGGGLPFPVTNHRPDFLSSAMTLIPRLQIWVRRLQRSGKKIAVVVDRTFFDALAKMGDARHVSNCDVAWFVVRVDGAQGQMTLSPDFVRFTTLEQAIEGLSTADTTTLEAFEARIRRRLTERISRPAVE